jgi:thiosulfate dehydrogenase
MKNSRSNWILAIGIVIVLPVTIYYLLWRVKQEVPGKYAWVAPDSSSIPSTAEGALIHYGKSLFSNTSYYLGPKGIVAKISNGMNCQNCHLDAGARNFGNSLSAVASTYPKYRPRSGRNESVEFRINECLERSLNGEKLDSLRLEMRALVAYLRWLGKDVPRNIIPTGAGLAEISFLDRAADTVRGRTIYAAKCITCHGIHGAGVRNPDSSGFVYPPLWGPDSYNTSAGLFRLSRFASFISCNMPFGTASHAKPQLSHEECWDLAAYVNSQVRPDRKFPYDWPDIKNKPADYPFGPYADAFSEAAHKYGPWGPIKESKHLAASIAK